MKERKGLTLVELLIVIGIIAVLAGIVFAVIGEVRWRVGVVQCSSNLHQIGLALRMYAQDWFGFAPPYCAIAGDFVSSSLLVKAFSPYVKSNSIWLCPRDPFGTTFGVISYGVDSHYCSTPVNIDHPPPVPPKTYFSSQCAICNWLNNNVNRWFYATDYHHRRIFYGPPGSWFTISLLLSGRVVARAWPPGLHGCPAKELPKDWPPDAYKDIP